MTPNSRVAFFQRENFRGRTDRYAPPTSSSSALAVRDLEAAIKGVTPKDVTGDLLSDQYIQDSVGRISSYTQAFSLYRGQKPLVDDQIPRNNYNFYRSIVNKRAAWVAGKGVTFTGTKGNELVAEVINEVWQANGGSEFLRQSAKIKLIAGDVFWYFSFCSTAEDGTELPKEEWTVTINCIHPSFVFPIYSEANRRVMSGVLLQFPYMDRSGENQNQPVLALYSMAITPKIVKVYKNDALVQTVPNVLGMIPLVHVANDPVGTSVFGHSELDDIRDYVQEYNAVDYAISRIIRYHAEPTTVIIGAKANELQRGASKVWSGLPPEAKVETLQLHDNLSAAYDKLNKAEAGIYRAGKTPKICYDSDGLAISNTSGVALALLFQPLVEATLEDQGAFRTGFKRANTIIHRIHSKIFGEDLAALADDPKSMLLCEPKYESLIPRDEAAELDMAIKRKEAKIWSQAELTRRMSGDVDSARLALELAADDNHELAMEAEKARALQGSVPNFSAAFLSSMFLNEELLDTASQVGSLVADNSASEETDLGENAGSDPEAE